jgi:adenine-specific DNA-methyltransferase
MKARARALRRNQTPAECELWKHLRLRQIGGVRFLRQYVMGGCILDFYAPSIWLAIELDGGEHYEPDKREHDEARSRWLASRGIEVLRYTNLEMSQRVDDVLDDIVRAATRLKAHPPAAARRPPSFRRG